jgi:hypothetical protein
MRIYVHVVTISTQYRCKGMRNIESFEILNIIENKHVSHLFELSAVCLRIDT